MLCGCFGASLWALFFPIPIAHFLSLFHFGNPCNFFIITIFLMVIRDQWLPKAQATVSLISQSSVFSFRYVDRSFRRNAVVHLMDYSSA